MSVYLLTRKQIQWDDTTFFLFCHPTFFFSPEKKLFESVSLINAVLAFINPVTDTLTA